MQKIYLLLRNNNQLGPFTIEELLEQEILPSDLVWIEGKSLAWSYASELNLLKLARSSGEGVHRPAPGPSHSSVHSAPHGRRKHHRFKRGDVMPPPPPAPEQKPRPAEPLTPAPMSSAFSAGDVERKAEELRQRALAAERSFHHRHPTPAETAYQPDLIGAMDDDIEVVYHKRKALNIPFPQMLVGGMVIAMLVAGWYGKPLFRQKVDTVDATATPLMSTQENAAAAPYKPAPAPAVATDTAVVSDSAAAAAAQPSLAVYTPTGGATERSAAQARSEGEPPVTTPETAAAERPPVEEKKEVAEESTTKEPEKASPIVVTAKKEPAQTEPVAEVSDEGKERKKGFLRGIFKKKKNRDGHSEEDGSDSGESKTESN
jgi:hypothetical protein